MKKKLFILLFLLFFIFLLTSCSKENNKYSIDGDLDNKTKEVSNVFLTDYKNIDLSSLTKEQLEDSIEIQSFISNYLILNSKVSNIPEESIAQYIETNINYYEDIAKTYNVTLEEYAKEYLSTDDINSYLRGYAENYFKLMFILEEIARVEKITVNDSDYKDYINDLVRETDVTFEEFEKGLDIDKTEFMKIVLYDKVLMFLEEINVKNLDLV